MSDHESEQQRKADASPKAKPADGELHGPIRTKTILDDGAGDAVSNGEAGFSRRMLANTADLAAIRHDYDGGRLHPVEPNTRKAHEQIALRSLEEARIGKKEEDANKHTGREALYAFNKEWAHQHGAQIQHDINSEVVRFQDFNSWIPRANGFFSSLSRLDVQRQMLGIRDNESLVHQLLQGIDDADLVAARMQIAHDQGHAPMLSLPTIDGTLDAAEQDATGASTALREAYLGFQNKLLRDEKVRVDHTGDQARARKAQIDENKAFVRNAGKTIDVAMKVIGDAPATIATATNALKRGEAGYGAWANRRHTMNGERQTHNPTYVANDPQGNMIVRNVQTGMDRTPSAKSGEPDARTSTPESAGADLPTNASGVLGTIADFAYAREVAEIELQLDGIKNHVAVIENEIERQAAEEAILKFQNALGAYARACNQLQRRMQSRRQQYLEFGVHLDNFARTDVGSRKAGLAPGRSRERYATVMSLISTVREVVATGDGALHSFYSTPELAPWIRSILEHRERADDNSRDLQQLLMP